MTNSIGMDSEFKDEIVEWDVDSLFPNSRPTASIPFFR